MMNLDSYFEAPTQPTPFPDVTAEIEAVRNGRKAMGHYTVFQADLDADDVAARVRLALSGGLQVTLRPLEGHELPESHRQTRMFVHMPQESWRVSAYCALMEIAGNYRWSDGLEALQSSLLGYRKEDILAWLAARREHSSGWAGIPTHMMIRRDQIANLARLGFRAFDPRGVWSDAFLFYRPGKLVLHRRITSDLPEHMTILRFSVAHSFLQQVFPSSINRDAVVSCPVDNELLANVNANLESTIETLDQDGWKSP